VLSREWAHSPIVFATWASAVCTGSYTAYPVVPGTAVPDRGPRWESGRRSLVRRVKSCGAAGRVYGGRCPVDVYTRGWLASSNQAQTGSVSQDDARWECGNECSHCHADYMLKPESGCRNTDKPARVQNFEAAQDRKRERLAQPCFNQWDGRVV